MASNVKPLRQGVNEAINEDLCILRHSSRVCMNGRRPAIHLLGLDKYALCLNAEEHDDHFIRTIPSLKENHPSREPDVARNCRH